MRFGEKLAEAAAIVERRLDALLAPRDDTPERLISAMRYAVLGGGKRLRPFLLLETAQLFGVATEAAVDCAAALECVHCYSLVHDDLPAMDGDETRRGRPTVWKAYDEWTAILAGDALLTLAFETLARPAAHPDPAVRAEVMLELARASGTGGMAGGQCLDLEADKLGRQPPPTLDGILRLQSMKTGALFGLACAAGAILGAARADQRTALRRFGDRLGLAFQMADDLLDVEGEASIVGKAVAKDAAQRKPTLVALVGVEVARRMLDEIETEAIAALDGFGPAVDTLREAAAFVSRRRW